MDFFLFSSLDALFVGAGTKPRHLTLLQQMTIIFASGFLTLAKQAQKKAGVRESFVQSRLVANPERNPTIRGGWQWRSSLGIDLS